MSVVKSNKRQVEFVIRTINDMSTTTGIQKLHTCTSKVYVAHLAGDCFVLIYVPDLIDCLPIFRQA